MIGGGPIGSPAVLDLGLGDSLRGQVADSEEERKKKLARDAAAQSSLFANPLRSATDTLFNL